MLPISVLPRSLQAASILYLGAALLHSVPLLVNAQAFENNGQFFTKGLAIIDAPAPNSQQHTGSNIVLAFELSGDGKIPQSSFVPGSGAVTRYDFFEVYLVSSSTQANFTVSNDSSILSQEPGSTVKHLNWPLPTCVQPGTYNLTTYEGSHINGEAFFSITPLSVEVLSSSQSSNDSECLSISNPLQAQPQADSAPAVNPIAGTGAASLTTITAESGLPTAWSVEPSGTDSVPLTTATMVVVAPNTITVEDGTSTFTTTSGLQTSTVTVVMPTSAITAGGFFPINGAPRVRPQDVLSTILLCLPALMFVLP